MKLSDMLKKTFVDEYWACAIRTIEDGPNTPLPADDVITDYQPVRIGARYWSADPFLVACGEKRYLFCELMRRGRKKASIGCAEIKNGQPGPVRPVIRAPYHLSYPAIFIHKGQYYMVPESRPSRTLTLWRATDFPYKWEQQAVLLENREIADATPYWDGRNWTLFVYEPNDEKGLRVLYTAPLDPENGTLGTLKKRALYTEKTGRPAGFPLRMGSRLILPTQIGVRHYGEAIAYRELVVNSRAFAERDCGRLPPSCVRVKGYRNLLGIHTINRLDNLEVIDILYRRFSPLRPLLQLFSRLLP